MPTLEQNSQPNNLVRQQGSGFVNLQDYLRANRGNTLGQQISQGVSGAVGNARNELNKTKEEFSKSAEKNRLGTAEDQALRDSTLAKISTYNPSQSYLDKDGNPLPPALIVNDQDKLNFQKYLTGNYSGPKELGNEQKLLNISGDVYNLGKGIASQDKRQGLLQRFVGGPQQYNVGQQRFDMALLGASPSGISALNQARKQTAQFGNDVTSAQQNARNIAQQYGNEAQGFGQSTREQINKNAQDIISGLQAQLASINQDPNFAQNLLNTARLAQGTHPEALMKSTIDQYGLGDLVGKNLYNLDLGSYINATQPSSIRDIASPEDAAKYRALQQLAGTLPGNYEITGPGKNYGGNFLGFDADKFKKDLASTSSEYNTRSMPLINSFGQYEKQMADLDKISRELGSGTDLNEIRSRYGDILKSFPGYDKDNALYSATDLRNQLYTARQNIANQYSQAHSALDALNRQYAANRVLGSLS